MKKLLLGSIALVCFSASILLFQVSCSKNAVAGPVTNVAQLNKIIYWKGFPPPSYGEIWTANYDGTNATKVNVALPNGFTLYTDGGLRLSPDGKNIFFGVRETEGLVVTFHIYKCNIEGNSPQKIVDGSSASAVYIGGVY